MKTTHRILWKLLALLFVTGASASGEEKLEDSLVEAGWALLGPAIDLPGEVLRESGSEEATPLANLDSPGITKANHLVAGEIRYQDVAGTGYLEMWTVYGEGERYFSRTLGDFGPMAKLAGSSDWRRVALPFQGSADKLPSKLELGVVLPGGGKVEFRDFRLYEAGEMKGIGLAESARTGARHTALAVGIVAVFLFAAMLLVSKGKGRSLVLGAMMGLVVVGAFGLVRGTMLASHDLPERWMPLLVGGTLALLAGGIGFPFFRKAYLKRELRRITATDRVG